MNPMMGAPVGGAISQFPTVMAQVLPTAPAQSAVASEERLGEGLSEPQVVRRQSLSSRWSGSGQARPATVLSGGLPQAASARWSVQPSEAVVASSFQPAVATYGRSASYTPSPIAYAAPSKVVETFVQEPPRQVIAPAPSVSYVPPQQPVLSYAPAPQMVRGPSFVAPPVQMPSFVAQPPPAQQPPQVGELTRGLPDPAAIDKQRNAYAKALDEELQRSIDAIQEKNAMEKKVLAQAAQQQKALYELQVEQALQGQTAALEEQRNMQLLGLQQDAMNQKIGLENQAAGLKLEYEQRKAQEEMMFKQYELQKSYFEAEQRMHAEMKGQAQAQQGQLTPAMPGMGASFMPMPSMLAPAAGQSMMASMRTVPQAVPGVNISTTRTAIPMETMAVPGPVSYTVAPPQTFQMPVTTAV